MHDELGVRMQRRLEQYRSGGSDLAVHPDEHSPVADQLRKLSIECKRAAKTTPALLLGWWAQAEQQAAATGLVPLLAHRQDRGQWRLVLPLHHLLSDLPQTRGLEWTVEVSLRAFAMLIREASR